MFQILLLNILYIIVGRCLSLRKREFTIFLLHLVEKKINFSFDLARNKSVEKDLVHTYYIKYSGGLKTCISYKTKQKQFVSNTNSHIMTN